MNRVFFLDVVKHGLDHVCQIKGRQIDSSFNIRHVCFYGTSGYGKRYEARN